MRRVVLVVRLQLGRLVALGEPRIPSGRTSARSCPTRLRRVGGDAVPGPGDLVVAEPRVVGVVRERLARLDVGECFGLALEHDEHRAVGPVHGHLADPDEVAVEDRPTVAERTVVVVVLHERAQDLGRARRAGRVHAPHRAVGEEATAIRRAAPRRRRSRCRVPTRSCGRAPDGRPSSPSPPPRPKSSVSNARARARPASGPATARACRRRRRGSRTDRGRSDGDWGRRRSASRPHRSGCRSTPRCRPTRRRVV